MRQPVFHLVTPWLIPRPPPSLTQDSSTIGGGTTWPTANRAMFQPFSMPCTKLMKSMSAYGAAAAGNFDLGLYDSTGVNLIASLGSTAMAAGVNTWTPAVPILLEAGVRYYAGLSSSSASAQWVRWDTPTSTCRVGGLFQMAAAHPLPNPVTPAVYASAYHPAIALDFEQ
jgi:hypothetical protein